MLAGCVPVLEKGWPWHGVPGSFVLLCILIIHKGFGHTWWKQDLLGVWEFVPIFIGIHLQPLHCHFSSHSKAGVKWAIVSQVAIQKLPSDLVVPAHWNVCCKQPCSEADWLATNCVSELAGVVAVDGCKMSKEPFSLLLVVHCPNNIPGSHNLTFRQAMNTVIFTADRNTWTCMPRY